ncbi:MAG: hypothetical protein N4A50_04300 [Vallitalea sp.]|jgi:hypothetical protein|nr:hypothetical protein [Vallitalea sp.]
MVSRNVGRKTAQGVIKGAGKGFIGAHVGVAVTGIANKIASVEKWFDNTSVGKAIDSGITSVENLAHKAIGGSSYKIKINHISKGESYSMPNSINLTI